MVSFTPHAGQAKDIVSVTIELTTVLNIFSQQVNATANLNNWHYAKKSVCRHAPHPISMRMH